MKSGFLRVTLVIGFICAFASFVSAQETNERISPVNSSAAEDGTELNTPLLIEAVKVEQAKKEIFAQLLQKAERPLAHIPVNPNFAFPAQPDNRWMNLAYAAAKNDAEIYGLVGDHLLLADTLLRSRYANTRLTGVDVARVAATCLSERLKNPLLAVRVADAYLLPNYRELDEGDVGVLTRVGIVQKMLDLLQAVQRAPDVSDEDRYKEAMRLIEANRLLIMVTRDESNADYARWDIAKILEKYGRFEEAIRYLNEVNPIGNQRAALNEIPRLQAKVDAQKKEAQERAAPDNNATK